jgi:hypothetical protein
MRRARSPWLALLVLLAACGTTQGSTRGDGKTGAQLDSSAIDVGLERVRGTIAACLRGGRGGGFGGPSSGFTIHMTIRNDGHVGAVSVDAEGLDPLVGQCLENAIATAEFPPFSGPPMVVAYPYSVL